MKYDDMMKLACLDYRDDGDRCVRFRFPTRGLIDVIPGWDGWFADGGQVLVYDDRGAHLKVPGVRGPGSWDTSLIARGERRFSRGWGSGGDSLPVGNN